jgi:adenylate kinase family enzyme
VRRIAITASASASGKSTVGRAAAERLGVPYVELDALHHGPNWTEASAEELRAQVEPLVEQEGWVIDGGYTHKIGHLVFERADAVVWLDLPMRTWLPRLLRRTYRRIRRREELWNGNRESVRNAIWGRDALIPFALRSHFRRRREYPQELAHLPVVRLRSQAEVDRWLETLTSASSDVKDRSAY